MNLVAVIILFLLAVILLQDHRLTKAQKEAAGYRKDYEWLGSLIAEDEWDKVPDCFTPSGHPIMITSDTRLRLRLRAFDEVKGQ